MEQFAEQRLMELAERGVAALEKLNEEPVINLEAAPPICPSCGDINPVIRTQESEARGPLGTFIVVAIHEKCGARFYAVPLTWHCFESVEEARIEIEQRSGVFSGNGS